MLLFSAAAGGEGVISPPCPPAPPRNNKLERFFMGQRSHMLPEPLCLSNWLCQSMNLAPHATEEWDSGPPPGPLPPIWHTHLHQVCAMHVHRVANEGSHCLAAAGQLETAPYLHLEDESICSSKTEAYCAPLFKLSAEWRLLSDSPWELCLQHCLALKHTCICKVPQIFLLQTATSTKTSWNISG